MDNKRHLYRFTNKKYRFTKNIAAGLCRSIFYIKNNKKILRLFIKISYFCSVFLYLRKQLEHTSRV
jgi:hypothetical protein